MPSSITHFARVIGYPPIDPLLSSTNGLDAGRRGKFQRPNYVGANPVSALRPMRMDVRAKTSFAPTYACECTS
jgi:hypothetical protein